MPLPHTRNPRTRVLKERIEKRSESPKTRRRSISKRDVTGRRFSTAARSAKIATHSAETASSSMTAGFRNFAFFTEKRARTNADTERIHAQNGKFVFKYKLSARTCRSSVCERLRESTPIRSKKVLLRRESYSDTAASSRTNSRVKGCASSRSAYCRKSERLASKSFRKKFRRVGSRCRISAAVALPTRNTGISSALPSRMLSKSAAERKPAHFSDSQRLSAIRRSKEFCDRMRPPKFTAKGFSAKASNVKKRTEQRQRSLFILAPGVLRRASRKFQITERRKKGTGQRQTGRSAPKTCRPKRPEAFRRTLPNKR